MKAFLKTNYSLIILGSVLISFQIIELSYSFTPLGKLGVVLWYGLILFLLIQVFKDFVEIVKTTISKRSYFSFLAYILVPGIVILFYVNQSTNLSLEATQQISCAIDNFKLPDWGFFQNCFLGYPARQFYLTLIPSTVSRTIISLNLGNFLYFLIGWTIFVNASMKILRIEERKNDLMLTLILFLPLHFFYFNYLFLQFEQAGYALGIGFALVGLTMRLKEGFSNKDLLLLAFFGYICIAGYTTTLAFIPLVSLLLLIIVLRKPVNKVHLVLVVMTILTWITSFIVTLDYRDDLRLEQNTNIETTTSLLEPLSVIVNQHKSTNYTSDIGLLIWIVILLAMLMYKFKFLGFIALLWIAGVIGFSIVSAGYASPDSTFALYRTMIIVPVILGLLVYNKVNFFNKKYLLIFVIVIAVSGVYYQYQHFITKTGNKSVILNEMYSKLNLHLAESPTQISLIDMDEEPYLPIKDGISYFLPQNELNFEDDLCNLANYSESYLISKYDLSTIECYSDHMYSLKAVNSFTLDSNNQNFIVNKYEFKGQ